MKKILGLLSKVLFSAVMIIGYGMCALFLYKNNDALF